jgi:hypothetical protein
MVGQIGYFNRELALLAEVQVLQNLADVVMY